MDTPKYNEALIAAKARKAAAGTTAQHGHAPEGMDRLPPGQVLTTKFPVLDLGVRPEIARADWKLEVAGLVDKPQTFTWEDFLKLPQTVVKADMHCVTTWSRYDNAWKGVLCQDIADAVGLQPGAHFVVQEGSDGYTTNIPLEDFLAPDSLIAYEHDGQPLPKEHGGPVRGVVPHLYAWKGSKFIKKITFVEKDAPGFWEVRGYNSHGDPWREERYS